MVFIENEIKKVRGFDQEIPQSHMQTNQRHREEESHDILI